MLAVEEAMNGRGPILTLAATSAGLLVLASLAPSAVSSGNARPRLQAAAVSVAANQPVLHLGRRGVQVRVVQQRLIKLGYLPSGGADSVFGQRTWHAVLAFQGWQRLQRDGVVGPRTRAALASAVRPQPWARLERGLALDLRRQVMLVVSHRRMPRAVHISSAAAGYQTPRGRFQVYRRERLSWSAPYRVWMPYALYFRGGYAIHGFGSVPSYPASHGCVRVPMSEAPFVYGATPLHAQVVVR
jgi:Putative peptidoglycan binding domain/L,D-transpeptidase catalytic domain